MLLFTLGLKIIPLLFFFSFTILVDYEPLTLVTGLISVLAFVLFLHRGPKPMSNSLPILHEDEIACQKGYAQ